LWRKTKAARDVDVVNQRPTEKDEGILIEHGMTRKRGVHTRVGIAQGMTPIAETGMGTTGAEMTEEETTGAEMTEEETIGAIAMIEITEMTGDDGTGMMAGGEIGMTVDADTEMTGTEKDREIEKEVGDKIETIEVQNLTSSAEM